MSQTLALTKVLQVREKEKKDAQIAHHQSMEVFEEIATKLYTLLKKKESAEDSYEQYIKETTPIEVIQQQMNYIETLSKQILQMQKNVNEARKQMEIKQAQLTGAHVEVKKFQKVIELRENEQKMMQKKAEQSLMDEISAQQYLNRKGD